MRRARASGTLRLDSFFTPDSLLAELEGDAGPSPALAPLHAAALHSPHFATDAVAVRRTTGALLTIRAVWRDYTCKHLP